MWLADQLDVAKRSLTKDGSGSTRVIALPMTDHRRHPAYVVEKSARKKGDSRWI
jgi:hypothetical protein